MLSVPKLDFSGPQGSGPLKDTEVYKLRDFYGLNTVRSGKRRTWYRLMLTSLLHPFNVLLIILGSTSGTMGEHDTMAIMLIMVMLSTLLRFYQEWRSEVAVESLLKFVATTVIVVRNDMVLGQHLEQEILSRELVPGDWIKLGPGEVVPADAEVLWAKDLHVSQSTLTGEAIPVMKYNRCRKASWESPAKAILDGIQFEEVQQKSQFSPSRQYRRLREQFYSVFGITNHVSEKAREEESNSTLTGVNFSDIDRPDVCFMGSAVVSGKATCRVINTSQRTIFGKLANELSRQRPANSFQLGVRRISWVFFGLVIVMVPPVLLLQGFLQHDWFDAFLFALSVAVGKGNEKLFLFVLDNISY